MFIKTIALRCHCPTSELVLTEYQDCHQSDGAIINLAMGVAVDVGDGDI